ncbi:MAG: class I SAM-dependent methyltransferase [Deltaproteobacteria bacterium]|nr:class I SAM-dependent methyltransferase [Deltaproteobacteria bacterium]MBW2361429.1 class I SAM-dependent methyltransferase [Deltaproteobacteria bacterium]
MANRTTLDLPVAGRDAGAAMDLTAKIEPFDSFWEGPEDIEKGYTTVYEFYRRNYFPHVTADREAEILVVSCGPGYFVDMLVRHGYRNVTGIDSDPAKVEHARKRNLECRVERAFAFLAEHEQAFDTIFCEQELNHLTKAEILVFLRLCRESLKPGGTLILHALNGANPITGAEALAQNFDHYNTFTEYTFRMILGHTDFEEVRVIPLNLYVFYRNPFNWVARAAASLLTLCFRAAFVLYGKNNRIFTKKIAAICRKPAGA